MNGAFQCLFNDDPGLTLTNITARSNLVACAFEWGSDLIGKNICVNEKHLTPGDFCSCPGVGAIYMFMATIFKHLLPLKPLGKSKPNCMWRLLGKEGGMKGYINGQGHMTKIAAMAINGKYL